MMFWPEQNGYHPFKGDGQMSNDHMRNNRKWTFAQQCKNGDCATTKSLLEVIRSKCACANDYCAYGYHPLYFVLVVI
jgi:hypothetical protein